MTVDEVNICLKYRIPVFVNKKGFNHSYLGFNDKPYFVYNIIRIWNQEFKEFRCSIGLSQDGRCVVTAPIENCEPDTSYCDFVNNKLLSIEKATLKRYLNQMFNRGMNKTEIITYLKTLIDETKGKAKRKNILEPFKKPTLDEIKAYIEEKGYKFNAEEFYDHYEANGWRVGKVPMRQWRSACANWNRRQEKFSHGQKTQKLKSEPSFDIDEIERKSIINDNFDI